MDASDHSEYISKLSGVVGLLSGLSYPLIRNHMVVYDFQRVADRIDRYIQHVDSDECFMTSHFDTTESLSDFVDVLIPSRLYSVEVEHYSDRTLYWKEPLGEPVRAQYTIAGEECTAYLSTRVKRIDKNLVFCGRYSFSEIVPLFVAYLYCGEAYIETLPTSSYLMRFIPRPASTLDHLML